MIKEKYAYHTLLLVSILVCSCATPKTIKTETTQVQDVVKTVPYITIQMSRSACFGRCPVYEMIVYSDGKCTFSGKAHVKNIGNFERQISEEELNNLKQTFDAYHFFDLKDEYVAKVSDLPTTIVKYDTGTKSKKVVEVMGAPADLKSIEKILEEFAFSEGWKSLN